MLLDFLLMVEAIHRLIFKCKILSLDICSIYFSQYYPK